MFVADYNGSREAALAQYGIQPAVRSALLVLLDERAAAATSHTEGSGGGCTQPAVLDLPPTDDEQDLDSDDVSGDELFELD